MQDEVLCTAGPLGAGHTGLVAHDRSTGFRPSANGFAFANSWPSGPAVSIPLAVGSIGIGNPARGLCGGMVFAALDYWHAAMTPPDAQPAAGTPLFRFIVRRLVESWRLPVGVARYYRWMLLPDGDLPPRVPGTLATLATWRPGVARRTTARQWPRVKALIDAGVPAPLGIVTVRSANPLLLGANHQVLGYGYSVADTSVLLHVYDPNTGPDDSVSISFDAAATAPMFRHNLGLQLPVRGFFLSRYSPARPPSPGRPRIRSRQPRGPRAAGTPSG